MTRPANCPPMNPHAGEGEPSGHRCIFIPRWRPTEHDDSCEHDVRAAPSPNIWVTPVATGEGSSDAVFIGVGASGRVEALRMTREERRLRTDAQSWHLPTCPWANRVRQ